MAVSQQEKEEKLKSMSDAVKIVIDNYPDGHEFYGNQLKDDVVEIYPDAINMYPDTILKMARRHRRESYIAIDHNNSLYKKVAVKSIVEQIKELAPKVEVKKERPEASPAQGFLFPLAVVFFVFALGAVFALEATFGRPLIPASFIASKSAFLYIPTGPMYLNGRMPFLWRRLFMPSEVTSKSLDISSTVISSIPLSIYRRNTPDQGENDKMFRKWNFLLYNRIVKTQKKCKFLKIFSPTLDYPLGRGYILYMF